MKQTILFFSFIAFLDYSSGVQGGVFTKQLFSCFCCEQTDAPADQGGDNTYAIDLIHQLVDELEILLDSHEFILIADAMNQNLVIAVSFSAFWYLELEQSPQIIIETLGYGDYEWSISVPSDVQNYFLHFQIDIEQSLMTSFRRSVRKLWNIDADS